MPDIIYSYDGSFDGLLSAVHSAYYNHENPLKIACENECQQQLFSVLRHIDTDIEKARAVRCAIPNKISPNALFNIYRTHLSNDINRGTYIFNYLRIGFKIGAIVDMLAGNKWVDAVKKTALRVSNEACKMREFVRFSEMENGVLFSKIEPENNVLEIICPYFADRLYSTPWVIADMRRAVAAVYDTKKWVIMDFDIQKAIKSASDENEYRKLWKKFYDTIAIESRISDRRRMSCMPKKYWKNMTEFQML